jgi:hypothetical protein
MVLLVVFDPGVCSQSSCCERMQMSESDRWRKVARTQAAGFGLRASSAHLQKSDAERRPRGLAECYLSRDPAVNEPSINFLQCSVA